MDSHQMQKSNQNRCMVCARVRPFSRKELEMGTENVIEMQENQTILHNPNSMDKIEKKQPKTFAFDYCFYSTDPNAPNFASQENVFDSVGRDILENAFQGYNACIFAYGQTGSGKSYTMMGTQDNQNKGIIPRLCDQLFESISKNTNDELTYKVEVSYMEIYNEKVHDLLDPKTTKQSLKVREHNVLGPYVDGLSQLAVTSFEDIDNLMTEGNKSRTVAATNMNAESSRSHAVFSIVLTQSLFDKMAGMTGEKVSRMSLVDLAGSERAVKTGAVGERLKEGSNINKSLTTLGLVISKLAEAGKGKDKFVPYRDSVLTWLLKDNLGGNSKTVMLATISPAADNYEETLSTLRYADRAKRIINHAVVNEDPNAKLIRELKEEIQALREMLKHATSSPVGERVDIHDKLAESEKIMEQVSQTWEEKLQKTERIQNERQQALEKMGISVQASGIQVEKNKYYLVNLNADPSLNELLVYYLKDRTLVGGRNTQPQPDIQLFGLGIQADHCVITIEDAELFMEPINNARCFVNGSQCTKKTPLRHGDRILWGNHHFFRVNCPRSANSTNLTSEPPTPAQPIDYNFARDEIMQNEYSNDPIQSAIAHLERQHEEDKQVALEQQRKEYEKQFQQLRNILSPTTPYAPYVPYDPLRISKMNPCTPSSQLRIENWAQERDEMFKKSLSQLKEDIMRANSLVQEANVLAEEMGKQTKFSVTLQIPPANLSPNRRRGAFASEPAILVKRITGSQIWSMEKLENKLIDMREVYQEFKDPMAAPIVDADIDDDYYDDDDEENENKLKLDPFYESQENHNLIGVANIFLEVLFHDVKLEYHTPIISQQGEVAGRLQIEISRIAGQFPQDRMCESASDSSQDSRDDEYEKDVTYNTITARISIKQASGLPLSLSNFVFCQYTFWGHESTVVPVVNQDRLTHDQNPAFMFNHQQDYTVAINEEFLEHCADGALSIEVWGHRSVGFSKNKGWEVEQQQAKARSLADRWAELSRKIELWVEIQELNDNGEYAAVEVTSQRDAEMLTGGVYQLRQGQQRRIEVRVKPVQNSGTLPIICQSIVSIAVGSVNTRSRLQKPLDSYQEEDLTILRDKWSEALGRRRKYLDQQIQKLINKESKTEQEKEREQSLVNQWVSLTEERNAVLVPAAGSGIPGAPANWNPPPGMEPHVPVLFLDLNADDLSTQNSNDELSITGLNSILPKEHGNKFYTLQILQHLDKDICAVASWDSSIHDSQALNRITESSERVYLILKTTVRLSHPAPMDLVLRKRLAINIYKRQSFTDKLKKIGRLGRFDTVMQTGVTYEVVSNIPKASEELEDRESLAQMAASGDDGDGEETYIEKYTKGVSAVESILTLDRLRQNVAIKELEQQLIGLQKQNSTTSMRKTCSVPNFSQAVKEAAIKTSASIMRFDTSMEGLCNMGRSESFAEQLNDPDMNISRFMSSVPPSNSQRTRHSFGGKSDNADPLAGLPTKQFGLARPTFLNLNLNLNSMRLQPTKPSPAGSKLAHRMTTLHEEPVRPHTLNEESEDCYSDNEYNDGASKTSYAYNRPMKYSRTVDSFVDIGRAALNHHPMNESHAEQKATEKTSAKTTGTPSMTSSTSSGYGSMCIDDTPDFDNLSSASPPNKSTFRRKQSDDFVIHKVSTSPIKKPLTPTNNHPLQNLREIHQETEAINEDEQDEDFYEEKLTKNDENRNKINNMMLNSNTININLNNNSDEIDDNQNDSKSTTTTTTNVEDEMQEIGTGIVTKELKGDQVVRRQKKTSQKSSNQRASFPMITKTKPTTVENPGFECSDTEKLMEEPIPEMQKSSSKATDLPEWCTIGESVLIRPVNHSGVISFIGETHFQAGLWVGVELDLPMGKNDGTVQNIQYFSCKPKHGIFVRPDKLILDKKGRAMRSYRAEKEKKETGTRK
ncbi:kinesin-like protein KIF13B isoform X3 [Culicoides brevitarsis]|uniref:kinesin-like protein KIF13B isoform X3 n=1 Tax=Culicoides brevitarsis TaxID=469753 RepID=UPI00307BA5D1